MSDPTLLEVKKAVGEVHAAFAEYQKVNDQRLEALAKGQSTAELEQKLERLNATIDENEKKHLEFLKKAEDDSKRIVELDRKFEAFANRAEKGFGGGGGRTERQEAEAKAFDSLLRKGPENLSADEMKVLTRSQDTTGGYLAPPTYVAEIIKGVVDYSPMRELVRVRTVGGPELQQPKRTQTAKASRIGETETRTETQNPAWGLLKISAPEMFAEARISQQNLEDSAFNLEAEVGAEFSEQFGVKEGEEIINGNGVNKCLGFLDANAAGPGDALDFTKSGSAATIAGASGAQADGLISLFHAVKTAYAARGRWVLNRTSLGKVRMLKDTNGQYLWQPGVVSMSAPATILGAPYTEAPDMPDEAANAFPIAFGDWQRAYTLVERVDLVITRDPYTLANVGQVKFHGRRRVGGQVVLKEAVRLLKCAA